MPNMKNWKKPKQPKANWTRVPGAKYEPKIQQKYFVPPRSKRMSGMVRGYRKLAEQYIAHARTCQRAGCGRPARDIHHTRGRAGSLLSDWRYWMALCRPCHDWVAEHPVDARSEGLLCAEGKWNVPDRTPIPRFER